MKFKSMKIEVFHFIHIMDVFLFHLTFFRPSINNVRKHAFLWKSCFDTFLSMSGRAGVDTSVKSDAQLRSISNAVENWKWVLGQILVRIRSLLNLVSGWQKFLNSLVHDSHASLPESLLLLCKDLQLCQYIEKYSLLVIWNRRRIINSTF